MIGAAVQISRLSKRYADFVAIDDVSLDVAPGEFVTLLGLSGSGKTTTLMAVAGFVDLDAGRITIAGRDIVDLPPEKRDLGVVFQNYALFPHLNVFENVAFPLRMRRWAQPAIERAVGRVLEIVSLGSFSARKIAELSGGQQQRVALARALVFEPPVLLMDEPLGALDRSLRDQLQTEIKRIQRDLGVTVIYVTHDQEEALALSDRIAVMAEGKICQLATPDEIYERPASAFVAGFVGESNFIDVRVTGQDGAAMTVSPRDLPERTFTATAMATPGRDLAAMAIRPEALRLASAGDGGTGNAIAGRIAIREFMGATVRLTIDTELGPMIIRDGRVSEAARFRAGDAVHLSWSERDALLFSTTLTMADKRALSMPTIIDFKDASAEPRHGAPAPERVVHGQPAWRSWLYLSENGMTSGRWESTPGCWTIAYDKWEFMTILSGRGVVRGEDGSQTELLPGATLVINPGFRGTWEVLETMTKHFFVRLR